ncbi:MAG: SpoIIE family protein phosphatase, partial [Oscillospiraceae bacterium]|nr:SpoIIE family protein phosphatase [Oscillospiraceae bacterium]
ARATLFGSISPFGLAVAGACGVSRYTLPALLGATLGYLSVSGSINSLKYIASIILIFTAHFVFSGTSLSKKRLFTPLSVFIPAVCINFVFLVSAPFSIFDTALSFLEIALSSFCAHILSIPADIETKNSSGTAAILTLALGLCSSLSGLTLFYAIIPGRILAFLIVSLCAFFGGTGFGAAGGLLFGCVLSLSINLPEHSVIFGVSALFMALFSRFGRLASLSAGFVAAACICACLNHHLILPLTIEFFVSSALFFVFEKPFSKYFHRFFAKRSDNRDVHLRLIAAERLNCAADAFRALSATLSSLHKKDEKGTLTDVHIFFEKSSRSLCKKCSLSSLCWHRDFESTRDAFTKAGNAILTNGELRVRDFPIHFSSRCMNTETLVNSVNREIFAMRYKGKFDEKLRESRELMTKQFSDAAEVFASLSSDIAADTSFDELAEAEISDALTRRGILCDTAVYRDADGHLNIHLCGRDLRDIEKNYDDFKDIFTSACKTPLSLPKLTESAELCDIVIHQKPPLRAIFGAAVKSRGELEQSGDSGTLFYPSHGKLALLLSDGMGSGKLAARESAGNIKLLSLLLRSGISPKCALSTLESALFLRSEFTGTFATLDLFYADMFSGKADFFKLGGAPTYIKHGEKIRRICSSSLPAGMRLGSGCTPDTTQYILTPGDFVIMTSDGIADGTDDVKLLEFLSTQKPASAKALADELLAFSIATYGKNDDMTVAVVAIEQE